jgi:endoglucanase
MAINDDVWNKLLADALQTIRASNPSRVVIIGPTSWYNVSKLANLRLPEVDRQLIATIHYYEPFHFTHQGASWVGPESASWLGTKWTGSAQEKSQIAADLDVAKNWGNQNQRPIYVGEFGAYSKADMDSRALWTRAVCEAVAARNFSAAYWEFGSTFGAFDIDHNIWREPLRSALIDGWKVARAQAY